MLFLEVQIVPSLNLVHFIFFAKQISSNARTT